MFAWAGHTRERWRLKLRYISVEKLYDLDNDKFEKALDILSKRSPDRPYASKLRLLHVSSQFQKVSISEKPTPYAPEVWPPQARSARSKGRFFA